MIKVQRMGILGLMFLFVFIRTGDAQINTYFINCGTNSSVNIDGRRWVGDTSPNNNVTLSSSGTEASTSDFNGDQNYAPLYTSARIFTENSNYTFRQTTGSYFLRLHFFPFSFQNFNLNQSSFSVKANGLTLLSEFNIPGEISHKNSSLNSLVKEFFFTVNGDSIVVEFIPSKGSFGFVNALEIIRVEDTLFSDSVNRVGGNGGNTSLNLNRRGIETVYRLNVGGSEIKPERGSGFYRTWEVDSSYMIMVEAGLEIRNNSNITYGSTNDISVAPLLVYETARAMSNTEVMEKRFNMSWKFKVDPNFDYLIRLHFCELEFNRPSQRSFRIYINNKTAADNFDVFVHAGGMNRAYHQDYHDAISSKIDTLWVQLGPDSTGTDALLNGLEIFKLSRDGNLAHVEKYGNFGGKLKSRSLILWVGIGSGLASIVILAVAIFVVVFLCKKRRESEQDPKNNPPGWRPLFLLNSTANAKPNTYGSVAVATVRTGRRFTLAEIRSATNNFDEGLLIGVGGFGRVFKGEIEDGTLVAIKRANPQSQQGLTEFETEIEMLSKLRHRHLVSMIGFCDEQQEMILVYEYMANGTLRSQLFGNNLKPLTWKQRLEICIGSARGLHYLHTGSEHGIIHRDVKTTNILLDEDFVAKMADFGLSKTGPTLEHTHVSTAVKGSFGYLDPEYFRRQQLTEKSDVYSFGVVLFEVVCARPVINPSLPRDQINLAEWAMRWQRERSLETIIDPNLVGKYSPESLMKFGEIAEKCLADEGKSRPTMGEILWHLEYVLQIHEAWLRGNNNDAESSVSGIRVLGSVEEGRDEERGRMKEEDVGVGAYEFSQLVNPQGR